MKKSITYFFFLIMICSFNNYLNAQVSTDKLQCGEKGTWKRSFAPGENCYNPSDYQNNIVRARRAFRDFLIGELDCNNFDCLGRDLFTCEAQIDGNIEGDLMQMGDKYCPAEVVRFSWSCTSCCRDPQVSITDTPAAKNQ